ncbi:MAG TPA: 3-oxoacyl-ACP reductase family protein [Bryobacteraceae bacterium]|nr:3-oxoacyl-ACP reductase family protein [Bryobacteraceae bacterium]
MADVSLEGRVAVVTGASRGLGREIALALSGAGAQVVSVARSIEGPDTFRCDVSREDDVAALETAVIARYGRVDILVNNAGVNVRKNVTEFTLEEWNRVLGTNLTGAFLMCRAFVPHMKGRGWGRIVNMTSMMSHISIPGRTAYSASKAGLLGMTRALALELAPEGITVMAISPGPFATEMNTPLLNDPELNQQFVSKIPVGRWGNPKDIGSLVLYLCSDAAGFLTGTDIVIDGGWMAQ